MKEEYENTKKEGDFQKTNKNSDSSSEMEEVRSAMTKPLEKKGCGTINNEVEKLPGHSWKKKG